MRSNGLSLAPIGRVSVSLGHLEIRVVLSSANDSYIELLARAITGNLGGRVGIAPRIFLKKLVADVLDRIDQYADFNPREHYSLTIQSSELNELERNAMAAANVDDVQLNL